MFNDMVFKRKFSELRNDKELMDFLNNEDNFKYSWHGNHYLRPGKQKEFFAMVRSKMVELGYHGFVPRKEMNQAKKQYREWKGMQSASKEMEEYASKFSDDKDIETFILQAAKLMNDGDKDGFFKLLESSADRDIRAYPRFPSDISDCCHHYPDVIDGLHVIYRKHLRSVDRRDLRKLEELQRVEIDNIGNPEIVMIDRPRSDEFGYFYDSWYINKIISFIRVHKLHRTDGPAAETTDGTKIWSLNGKLHREDGPAIEKKDGTKIWYQNGVYHREDGPAYEGSADEGEEGTKIWYKNGHIHREDGPAFIIEDAYEKYKLKEWYINGKLHREDGPAWVDSHGQKEWYINGKQHRDDGPAIVWEDGTAFWYLNDKRYSFDKFLKKAPLSRKRKILLKKIYEFADEDY